MFNFMIVLFFIIVVYLIKPNIISKDNLLLNVDINNINRKYFMVFFCVELFHNK